MTNLNPVEIIGGGLAGLALGLSLRRAGTDVTVREAGRYPRHRVCGEFIAGLGDDTIERLGIGPLLLDARRLGEVEWFLNGCLVQRTRLPAAALAISRYRLDARMAEAFTEAGGKLLTDTRRVVDDARAGRVFTTGRHHFPSPWLGLKLHAHDLSLDSDLELHLGDGAYVGLCPVEDGRINVCGLFRQRPGIKGTRELILLGYLRAAGLNALAVRLEKATVYADSCVAVAGINFARRSSAGGRLNLGEAFAMIPPFTGNGMAMAFQSAELALDPLLAWSHGKTSWNETLRVVRDRLHRKFQRRLSVARVLHPFFYGSYRQRALILAARARIVPFEMVYRLLH